MPVNEKKRRLMQLAALAVFPLSAPYFLLRKSRHWPENPASILVIRLDHIGDAVMALPALRAIRRRFPESRVTLLCAPWNEFILRSQDVADDYIVFAPFWYSNGGDFEDWRRILRDIRARHFDLTLNLRHEEMEALTAVFSGARFTAGYGFRVLGLYLDRTISYRPVIKSETVRNLELLRFLGIFAECNQPTLKVKTEWRDEAAGYLNNHHITGGEYMVVHPTARAENRRWPPMYYREVITAIATSRPVIIIATRDENDLITPIIADTRNHPGIHLCIGELTLGGVIGLMDGARGFLGNDSGMAHIAAALGIPTFVIFGGQAEHTQWRQIGDNVTTFRHKTNCTPCYQVDCAVPGMPCLWNIKPETVIKALQDNCVI
jgi:ADP-heptose:LPS heptosyltransferase